MREGWRPLKQLIRNGANGLMTLGIPCLSIRTKNRECDAKACLKSIPEAAHLTTRLFSDIQGYTAFLSGG
jgi:hypothetical protein